MVQGTDTLRGGSCRAKVPLFIVGTIAVLIATYFGFQTLRVGHAYNGTPQEIVDAMLRDIRADIEAEDWSSLGSYGVGSFLSWHDETKLREYVEEDLDDEPSGPVDYILKGMPSGVTSVGGEIHFMLLEPRNETTCRVVLKKSLGLWLVKDISQLGGTGQ